MEWEYVDMPIQRIETLNQISVPDNVSIDFSYDTTRCILLMSISVLDTTCNYLGRGRIRMDNSCFQISQLSVVDPFLVTKSHILPKNFKIFFKAIYPKLLRDKLPVTCFVSMRELPVVTISVSSVTNEEVRYHIHWVEHGQDAKDVAGLDGYVFVDNIILKGSRKLIDLMPHHTDGEYISHGNEAKRLGMLCDVAGFMFCGKQLNDLRILGRGLTLQKENTISSFSLDFDKSPITENINQPTTPPAEPIIIHYDGPALLSVQLLESAREANSMSVRFATEAKKYASKKGSPCEYIQLKCYWPTYAGMDEMQKKYFFYFRTAFMSGQTPKADLSYIFIAVYELINRGFSPSEDNFRILLRYWSAYRDKYPKLDLYMSKWCIDYILTNELPISLSEVALAVPQAISYYADYADAVLSDLLKDGLHSLPCEAWRLYCRYDVTQSRLWDSQYRTEYEMTLRRVFTALQEYVEEVKGVSLLKLYKPNVQIKDYPAFCGAVCARVYRKNIRLEYVPYSKSVRLNNLLESVVKYTENALRIRHKIMGRLRVGNLPDSLLKVLDQAIMPLQQKVEVRVPPIQIDLSKALTLEKSSWDNTRAMLDAVDNADEVIFEITTTDSPSVTQNTATDNSFFSQLSDTARLVLCAMLDGADRVEIDNLCLAQFSFFDAVCEEINEKAVDLLGDIILDGDTLIEDYIELINVQRKELP